MTVLSQPTTLLTFDPITTAVAALTSTPVSLGRVESLAIAAEFAYGAGGTTVKAWVQTSLDGGTNWMDIANFAFTTAAARRAYNLTNVAVTAIATPVEGTLADGTSVNGFLGSVFRVKYTTTGTYTGATSLKITAVPG